MEIPIKQHERFKDIALIELEITKDIDDYSKYLGKKKEVGKAKIVDDKLNLQVLPVYLSKQGKYLVDYKRKAYGYRIKLYLTDFNIDKKLTLPDEVKTDDRKSEN